MSLYHKVRSVEKVFQHLDKEIASFKNASGLQCMTGCGLCCRKPDISSTPLEFLPLAYHLYKYDLAEEWWQKFKNTEKKTCILLHDMVTDKDAGYCSQYMYRGLVCRLFGYSAMLDKYGNKNLSTCSTIKAQLNSNYQHAVDRIREGLHIPVMRDYYFKLRNIDSELGQRLMPINEAIIIALEYVLAYYAYRKPRKAS
ncbi:YkgJ family cysteine cluster protein [Fulvivirga sp. RKSG066]|uniref:YkgJ family cysteine cluster protein n=1 Tax=Fulvivirga aurantia TaxID=2529383 RepID=UPI0012BC6EFE|nr:YkgJ family cysteine cluster protein [Fulvivirga aurantia]MTI22129.1 YkgJ family cysteine cluster protein [Fulvivirga aurantia]